jgi:hypothetical protein
MIRVSDDANCNHLVWHKLASFLVMVPNLDVQIRSVAISRVLSLAIDTEKTSFRQIDSDRAKKNAQVVTIPPRR